MSRRTKIYASAGITRPLNVFATKGEQRTFSVDYKSVAVGEGTTISESAWSVGEDEVISLSGNTISGYQTSVSAEALQTGSAIIRNTVVFANDSKQVNQFRVSVKDYTSLSRAA